MCRMFHRSIRTLLEKRHLLVDLTKKIEIFHLEKLITKINCMFFQSFLLKTPTLALLMHSNDVSKLWHDMFGNINLR